MCAEEDPRSSREPSAFACADPFQVVRTKLRSVVVNVDVRREAGVGVKEVGSLGFVKDPGRLPVKEIAVGVLIDGILNQLRDSVQPPL